jgi:hypothetical protein
VAGPEGAGAGSGLLARRAFFNRSYSAATESNLDWRFLLSSASRSARGQVGKVLRGEECFHHAEPAGAVELVGTLGNSLDELGALGAEGLNPDLDVADALGQSILLVPQLLDPFGGRVELGLDRVHPGLEILEGLLAGRLPTDQGHECGCEKC